ncbi:MAG: primosomal protein N' [Patescibacteria group bacterium]
MSTNSYANIIVNSRLDNISGELTYSIPPTLSMVIKPGQLVLVPFGRRFIHGVVANIQSQRPAIKVRTKDIAALLGERPIVKPEQIKLAQYISQHYHCSLGQALFAMIPSFVMNSIKKVYSTTSQLSPHPIVQFINTRGGQTATEILLLKKFGATTKATLSRLVKKDILRLGYQLSSPKIKPKYEEIISLCPLSADQKKQLSRYPKQNQVYQFLKYRRLANWIKIRQELNVSRATIRAMQRKKMVDIETKQVIREPLGFHVMETVFPDLVGSQQKAWQTIVQQLNNHHKKPIMLFGRTGSGKTELYLRAAEWTLKQGKGVIILVPEIALVPQTLQRFYERFGQSLAVYHSQMSVGERYDQWFRLYNHQAQVVIGSRSALFAPVPNLGLIIIDEEHEYSYKQDNTPRYHAVDAAVKYAKLTDSLLILGSATPRLETFWRAKKGEYELVKLTKTITETVNQQIIRRPEISIVDLRDEYIAGNHTLLSIKLQESIQKALLTKKQILLFLNRRGHTTYVFCRECGFVAKCPECNIPMTLHINDKHFATFTQHNVSLRHALICHHCGLTMHNFSTCPECSSKAIKYYGAGTQKIEEDTRALFPQARILRMDYDTTRTRNAHQKIFQAFKDKRADILIGTQMITKGWDLPNVDLIGIVNADGGFNLPDFRATEKNFSLLLQLIGRVGRGHTPGRVVLQTYDPDNPLFDPLLREDYQLFAFSELIERKNGNFPPFVQLVRLVYESPNMNKCKNEAVKLFKLLNEKFSGQKRKTLIEILGPTPAFLARIKQKYRWHIILKGHNLQKFLDIIPADWIIDVDPFSLL